MKKFEYKGKNWHEECFCCKVCNQPIGTKSFIPREQEVVCVPCYEEQYAQRCMKCVQVSKPCMMCVQVSQPCMMCVQVSKPCMKCVQVSKPCMMCVQVSKPCMMCVQVSKAMHEVCTGQ